LNVNCNAVLVQIQFRDIAILKPKLLCCISSGLLCLLPTIFSHRTKWRIENTIVRHVLNTWNEAARWIQRKEARAGSLAPLFQYQLAGRDTRTQSQSQMGTQTHIRTSTSIASDKGRWQWPERTYTRDNRRQRENERTIDRLQCAQRTKWRTGHEPFAFRHFSLTRVSLPIDPVHWPDARSAILCGERKWKATSREGGGSVAKESALQRSGAPRTK